MSDVWYCVEGETTKGPMTLAELTAILSATPEGSSVLVWRPGLANWERAANVRELADALFRRPRLEAGASIDPAEPWHPASPHAVAVSDPHLQGIGGWLILVAIGQVLGPARYVQSLGEYYRSFDDGLVDRFPLTFIVEGFVHAAFVVFAITTAILFFRKSRLFPRLFICELLATVFLGPALGMWAVVTIGAATGQSVAELMQNAFPPVEIARTVATAAIASIWMLYAFKSKRVANTFVH